MERWPSQEDFTTKPTALEEKLKSYNDNTQIDPDSSITRNSLVNAARWKPSAANKTTNAHVVDPPESPTLQRIPSQENIAEPTCTSTDGSSPMGMAYFLNMIRENPTQYEDSQQLLGGYISPQQQQQHQTKHRAPFHQRLAERCQDNQRADVIGQNMGQQPVKSPRSIIDFSLQKGCRPGVRSPREVHENDNPPALSNQWEENKLRAPDHDENEAKNLLYSNYGRENMYRGYSNETMTNIETWGDNVMEHVQTIPSQSVTYPAMHQLDMTRGCQRGISKKEERVDILSKSAQVTNISEQYELKDAQKHIVDQGIKEAYYQEQTSETTQNPRFDLKKGCQRGDSSNKQGHSLNVLADMNLPGNKPLPDMLMNSPGDFSAYAQNPHLYGNYGFNSVSNHQLSYPQISTPQNVVTHTAPLDKDVRFPSTCGHYPTSENSVKAPEKHVRTQSHRTSSDKLNELLQKVDINSLLVSPTSTAGFPSSNTENPTSHSISNAPFHAPYPVSNISHQNLLNSPPSLDTMATDLFPVPVESSSALLAEASAMMDVLGVDCSKPPPSMSRDLASMVTQPPPPLGGVPINPPPGHVTILKRPEASVPLPTDVTSLIDQASHFDQSKKVKWTDISQGRIGWFFINKVKLVEKCVWMPKGALGHTQCMDFDELALPTEAREVFIANGRPFSSNMMPYLMKFPAQCKITVHCPMARGGYWSEKGPQTTKHLCPQHAQLAYNDEEVYCNPSTCEKVRTIVLSQKWNEKTTKCNFLLIRYLKCLRMLVVGASLDQVNWDKVQQFGWYFDFPLNSQNQGEKMTSFGRDLTKLVTTIQPQQSAGDECILQGVDFTALSPHVHLITAIPGEHPEEEKEFSWYKVSELRSHCTQLDSRAPHKFQNFCQTTRFGKGKAVIMLDRLMELSPDISSRRAPVKIVYPSSEHVARCVEQTEGLTYELLSPLFYNKDASHMAAPYLYDPIDEPVIPHANIYKSGQMLMDKDIPRCYGYLITGSQGLSYGSWGDKTSVGVKQYRCARFELAVGIFPYTDANKAHHAVDLNEISLPWTEDNIKHHRSPAHEPKFLDNKSKDDSTLPIYIGIAKRYLKKEGAQKVVFVDPLPEGHPLNERSAPFPGRDSCYLSEEILKRGNNSQDSLPPLESVVEFHGVVKRSHNRKRRSRGGDGMFRAHTLLAVHETLNKAMEAHGIDATDVTYDETPLKDKTVTSVKKTWSELTPTEQMAKKGITTDEEFDAYWAKYMPTLPQDPKLSKLTEAVNTKPTPLESNMGFLERYAKKKARDSLPKILMGPFNIHYMHMDVEHSRRLFLQRV